MEMLCWVKSDRREVWRGLSRKKNTSGAQASLLGKRGHPRWKEQGKRVCRCAKEPTREPPRAGSFPQPACFARLGGLPCWGCQRPPQQRPMTSSVCCLLVVFALVHLVPIRKGSQEAAYCPAWPCKYLYSVCDRCFPVMKESDLH